MMCSRLSPWFAVILTVLAACDRDPPKASARDAKAGPAVPALPKNVDAPLYEQLKDEGILVRYMDYPRWGDGLRISVGTDRQIETCLDRLKALM